MKNIEVDVVIPVYDGYEELVSLYNSFKNQKNINIKRVVVPLTIGDDYNQVNKTKQFIKENKIISFDVLKKDFSHSLTRERAILNYCRTNIVILLTQDAKLLNEYSMYNLVRDIKCNKVVYTFGRQICLKKRCIERYIRDFNYSKDSYIIKKELINKYQIRAFFASDVFAGLNRNIFIELNGYQGFNLSTNEDMLYMYILLSNNHKAKYCSDAMVEHYHSYSLKNIYIRYYEVGKFFKDMSFFNKYKRIDSGFKLAIYVLKEAFKHFDVVSVFRWLPNMIVRFLGLNKGKNS